MDKPGLNRRIGLFSATNIVIANMIGAGIFTTSGLLLSNLNNPITMLVLWIAGGFIALCGALSYGELGAMMPEAGGEYLFLSRIYHPAIGFLSGWVSLLVGFSAPIAASAIGFSEYFVRAFPGTIENITGFSGLDTKMALKLISVSIIALFSFIHARGLKTGIGLQNFLTVLKVFIIVVLIMAAIFSDAGDYSNFGNKEINFGNAVRWSTIGLSLMWIMFAYSGWNAATYIGSEIKNPLRTLPLSLIAGTSIVILLYVLLNFIYIYAIPTAEMKGVISVGGLAMRKLFGASFDKVFSILIAFALFSSLSAFIIIGPRVYYAMAKDRLFFSFVSRVHPTCKVPAMAIYLQGIIAIIYVMSGTFEQILTYMGFSLGIFPILTIGGIIVLGIRKKRNVKMPGFPFVQVIYIITGTIILILAFMNRPVESGIAIFVLLTGFPVYMVFDRKERLLK